MILDGGELADRVAAARARIAVEWSPARAQAVASSLGRAQRRRAIRRDGALLVCALALVAGALHHAMNGRQVETPARDAATTTRHFRDGSIAVMRGGRGGLEALRVIEEGAGRTVVELRDGGARFEVRHDPARLFRVVAGGASVDVLGTVFSVERDGRVVDVSVEIGRVRVRADGRERLLGAGEHARVSDAGGAPDRTALAVDPALVAMEPDPVDALLTAADRARATGRPSDAERLLRRAIDLRPHDGRAPLAAFTRGRVLLEDLDRARDAADAFAEVIRLDAASPLAADARARRMNALGRTRGER